MFINFFSSDIEYNNVVNKVIKSKLYIKFKNYMNKLKTMYTT